MNNTIIHLFKIHQDFTEEMMRRCVREDEIALFIKHIKNEKDARFIEETMQDVLQVCNFIFGPFGCDDIGIHSPEKVFKKILINEFLNHYDKHKNTYQMYFDLSESCKLKDLSKYFDKYFFIAISAISLAHSHCMISVIFLL